MDIYGNEVYNIRQVLEKLTDILQEMLGVMKKPENRFKKALQYFVLFVSALGILGIIELIRQWVLGG